ncbi:helix-turn-helix transcriptional regulator [Nocardia inohanensis]|uniref:helix-turn-helix transcriptional regulator n=1 Tax=Nocardia inohanensis TaxID=209246 RepID=UPI00082B4F6F|nr:LuxR family transcriptional regulator [Nocardia inohanensis]
MTAIRDRSTAPDRAPSASLVGREAECLVLETFTTTVRSGLSEALVLAGPPGIGKTRLLDHLADTTQDLLVLRTSGIESELPLAFAALHRLLRPFLDRREHLPEPQKAALGAAFGFVAGPAPDRFLVGLATLSLFADLAAEGPLLCLVDDAQWLDRESREALTFVARRLHAEGVGLVFAVRELGSGSQAFDGLRVYPVAGLPASAAEELLARTVRGPLSEGVARQLAEQTRGNPLALATLVSALTPEQLGGTMALPEPLPIGARLTASFLAQIRALAKPTQDLLLLASISPIRDAALLWRAAALLGLSEDDAYPAIEAGVLAPGNDLAFSHPLIRSAVYNAARPSGLRRAHQAISAACDPDHDPDIRAWHLAAATAGLDESVARDLENSAARARARGGYTAEAVLLARAAELTPAVSRRDERRLAAAQVYLMCGDPQSAQRLFRESQPESRVPAVRGRARWLRAAIEAYFCRFEDQPALMLAAAAELGSQDGDLAWLMLSHALSSAMLSREDVVGTTLTEVAHATLRALEHRSSALSVHDLFIAAFATRISAGHSAALPRWRIALSALCEGELAEEGMPLAVFAHFACDELWDDSIRQVVFARLQSFDRAYGALVGLRVVLECQAADALRAGRPEECAGYLTESQELLTVIGLPDDHYLQRLELLVWSGAEAEARALASSVQGADVPSRAILAAQAARYLIILEVSLGNDRAALRHARFLYDEDVPGLSNLMLADMVEAGVRAQHNEPALLAYARLETQARESGTPWALGSLARARALLTNDDSAASAYQEAIDQLGQTTITVDLARTHLLYGEWLRRRKQRSEARIQLRIAYEMFTTARAPLFAERARAELAATGERVRRSSPTPGPQLTPQESKIAALAAEGATNTEIAARLYISASTVEYHLTKVFRKLAVTSRRQLRSALGSVD